MTALWIIGIFLLVIVIPGAFMLWKTMPIAHAVYKEQLVRDHADKWKRENSCPSDAEYSLMYRTAEEWAERFQNETVDVSIQSQGLRLCGRFTDFGSPKTAVVLCGRAEGCIYSYYYAEPYRKAGFNILVVDQRAHGESEGVYSGIGFLEQNDVIEWISLLERSYHTSEVIIHGVCIGAACAVYTASNPNCPKSVKGIVVDGLYRSFHDVFIARFHTNKRPLFPVLWEVEYLIRKHTGINVKKDSPAAHIANVHVPIMLIHSKEDVSSLPEHVPELVHACTAPTKMVWAPKGAHSHVRIQNQDLYDSSIQSFLDSLGKTETEKFARS